MGIDRMEVFAVFPDGELWDGYWDGASWHPWEALGGELAGLPAASSWGDDRLDVVAPIGARHVCGARKAAVGVLY